MDRCHNPRQSPELFSRYHFILSVLSGVWVADFFVRRIFFFPSISYKFWNSLHYHQTENVSDFFSSWLILVLRGHFTQKRNSSRLKWFGHVVICPRFNPMILSSEAFFAERKRIGTVPLCKRIASQNSKAIHFRKHHPEQPGWNVLLWKFYSFWYLYLVVTTCILPAPDWALLPPAGVLVSQLIVSES